MCECPTCKLFEQVTAASKDDRERILFCVMMLGRALRGCHPLTVVEALQLVANSAANGPAEPMGPKPTVNEAGRA